MLKILAMIMAVAVMLPAGGVRAAEGPTVFAAASLRDVLQEAAAKYEQDGHGSVRLVFAASSVLARQIDAGAPADLYLSADDQWMEWLVERGSVNTSQIRPVAGNRLVVAYGAQQTPPANLDAMLTSGKFSMADPRHVPAGRYAAAALNNLNILDLVEPHAIYTENVRVALEFLRRGEVTAAIVYFSDLAIAPELVVAFEFPGDSHPPIRYVAAPVIGTDERAQGFLEFLTGDQGQAFFEKYDFGAPMTQ